jgi:deazaflavin-dependent oxidoreductase (nitroreductase family)
MATMSAPRRRLDDAAVRAWQWMRSDPKNWTAVVSLPFVLASMVSEWRWHRKNDVPFSAGGTVAYAKARPLQAALGILATFLPEILRLVLWVRSSRLVPVEQTGRVPAHYRAPGWFTRNVFNRAVAFLTRHGVSIVGSRVLAVRGRTSGEWRTTPVNLLDHDGRRYLVSPRGEGQWVRNLRVAGTGELRVGRRTEAFRGRELSDEEKVPVLRAYLKRWKFEVGVFFDGVGPDSSDDEIRAIAARHPAFEVLPADE